MEENPEDEIFVEMSQNDWDIFIHLTIDGDLRVYFKNGNEPQAGISGFDNQIHSALSSDGGRTWVIEKGVRIPVQSPVEALVIDGKVAAWGWRLSATGDALPRIEKSIR